jgi:hypothetical protein
VTDYSDERDREGWGWQKESKGEKKEQGGKTRKYKQIGPKE